MLFSAGFFFFLPTQSTPFCPGLLISKGRGFHVRTDSKLVKMKAWNVSSQSTPHSVQSEVDTFFSLNLVPLFFLLHLVLERKHEDNLYDLHLSIRSFQTHHSAGFAKSDCGKTHRKFTISEYVTLLLHIHIKYLGCSSRSMAVRSKQEANAKADI